MLINNTKGFKITKNEIYILAKNSFQYSLLDEESKKQYIEELENYVDKYE